MASERQQPMSSKDFARNSAAFKKNNDNITHVLNEFDMKLKELTDDIKALGKGKKEYGDQLKLLQERKDLLQARVAENEKWAANFDSLIGPFEDKYATLRTTIAGLYEVAKDKHAKGLVNLIENFAYHPEFKRWNDTFTSNPFKPK